VDDSMKENENQMMREFSTSGKTRKSWRETGVRGSLERCRDSYQAFRRDITASE
jgi:hypothetical protein